MATNTVSGISGRFVLARDLSRDICNLTIMVVDAVALLLCFQNCNSWLGCCQEEHHAFWSCFQDERVSS